MFRIITICILAVLLAAPAIAQPNMAGFEFTPYLQADGYRIFFDSSVAWDFGGTLMDPMLSFWQTQIHVDAYLVLVEPTATALGGFRIGLELVGGAGLVENVLGAPLSVQVVDDVMSVTFDPPLVLDGSSVPLIYWSFLNVSAAPVDFYLWPAPGDLVPVYLDGAGDPVTSSTYNGPYYQYAAPAVTLNGGVTPNEPTTWGGVKVLYR